MRQQDLAKKAGVSRKTICDVEAGRPAMLRTLLQIEAALGFKQGEVLSDEFPPEKLS